MSLTKIIGGVEPTKINIQDDKNQEKNMYHIVNIMNYLLLVHSHLFKTSFIPYRKPFEDFITGSGVLLTSNDEQVREYYSKLGNINYLFNQDFKESFLATLVDIFEGLHSKDHITNPRSPEIVSMSTTNIKSVGNNIVVNFKIQDTILQFDFKFVKYVDGKPLNFIKKFHDSNIDDVKSGFKSVFRNMALKSLTSIKKRVYEARVLKSKNTKNIEIVPYIDLIEMDFERGLFFAYEPIDIDGSGKLAYHKKKKVNKNFETDITIISKILFDNFDCDDTNLLFSLKGLIELTKKYLDENEQQSFKNEFIRVVYNELGDVDDDPSISFNMKKKCEEFILENLG